MILSIFSWANCNPQAILGEISILIFGPFFSWVVCTFDIELQGLFICSGDVFLVGMSSWNFFFFLDSEGCPYLSCRVSFGMQILFFWYANTLKVNLVRFLNSGLLFTILKGLHRCYEWERIHLPLQETQEMWFNPRVWRIL